MMVSGPPTAADAGAAIPIARAADTTANEIFVMIRSIVESNPGISLVSGVPVVLIAGVVAVAIVVEFFGGVIFDFDVNIVYREVFRKLDEMVVEMEELRS